VSGAPTLLAATVHGFGGAIASYEAPGADRSALAAHAVVNVARLIVELESLLGRELASEIARMAAADRLVARFGQAANEGRV
jgi:hypothetical protein